MRALDDHDSPLRMRMVSDTLATYASQVARSNNALAGMRDGESIAEYASRRDEILSKHISVIARQTSYFDAFDLLELLRQREMPGDFDNFEESSFDGVQAITELAAVLLLSRSEGRRKEAAAGRRPDRLISMIHRRLSEVLTINHWQHLENSNKQTYGPLTELAARHLAHVVTVRGDGFPSIRRGIEHELFSPARIQNAMERSLGFRYDDFLQVQEAVDARYVSTWNSRLKEIPEHIWNTNPEPEPEELDGRIGEAFAELFVRPGTRASFRADEIAEKADVPQGRAHAVLEAFAQSFTPGDPLEAAKRFLQGQNDFRAVSLIKDSEGNYLSLAGPVGIDTYRQFIERALKSSPDWNTYLRHRSATAESLAIGKVQTALQTEASYRALKYWAPKAEEDVSKLHRGATGMKGFAKEGEADGVFIVEDVLICVEVKGGAFSDGARQGRVNKLETDLEKLIGDATRQAHRLEQLVVANGGIWTLDNRWLDLSHVRETRTIVVTLDDLGFLGTAIDELVRAGILTEQPLPWIVALSDLWLIADVLDRPSEFLLYLRKRSDTATAMHFLTMDELDLFMLFLRGDLRVGLDPRRVFERYPRVGAPSAEEIAAFESGPDVTRVMTLTDELDAWKYYVDGHRSIEAPKPTFHADPMILQVVDFLNAVRRPGWFSFAPVLLNLPPGRQRALRQGVAEVVTRMRRDRRVHSMFTWTVDEFGLCVLTVVGKPKRMPLQDAVKLANAYLIQKRGDFRAERGFALVVDQSSRIVSAEYLGSGGALDNASSPGRWA